MERTADCVVRTRQARMLNADTMYRNTCVMFSHLMTYILRPNPWMTQQIEAKLAGSFPSDFDPMRAVGLPIRGSDKCIGHGASCGTASRHEQG
jgi:hypothetical protein